MTQSGTVVPNCSSLKKPAKAFAKDSALSRSQGTAAWLNHHTSLDSLVFLVGVGRQIELSQLQRRLLCVMEIGGAGNTDLEAVDTRKRELI